MVDNKQPDPSEAPKEEETSKGSTSTDDWGEDWESAFQAEEFLFSEDSQPPPDENDSSGYDFTPSDESSFGDLPGLDADDQEDQAAGILENDEEEIVAAGGFSWFPDVSRLQQRLTTIPTKIWLAITGTLTLLLLGTILFQILGPRTPSTDISMPKYQQPPEAALETAGTSTGVKAKQKLSEDLVVPPQKEKTRAKWEFAPFLIPTTDKESQETTFVFVKLTITTLLDDDEELPQDQKPFIRDMIFQFFANRPFYELRRFSLARGEMNNKLLEWLRREWPEGTVTSIIFQRYKIG